MPDNITVPSRYFWYFTKQDQYTDSIQDAMIAFGDRGFLIFASYATDFS